jgi:WG containing repeat
MPVKTIRRQAFATLYATSVGERAYEYPAVNQGFFSWAFNEGLKGKAANANGEVTLGALIKYVEETVPQQVKLNIGANIKQEPSHLIQGYAKSDELVISIGKPNLSQTNSGNLLNPITAEQAFWQAIENSNDIEDFESYLLKCEKGEFLCSYRATTELKLNKIKKEKGRQLWASFSQKAKSFLKYDEVAPFSEGIAKVKKDNKYGFVGQNGKEVVFPKYDFARSFTESFAVVAKRKYPNDSIYKGNLNPLKFGFIDKTGNEVIPLKFDDAIPFSEGLAGVLINGKYGFINNKGLNIIPYIFDENNFKDGDDWVCNCGDFDDQSYDDYQFKNGVSWASQLKKWALIDKSGKAITPFKYVAFWDYSEGVYQVEDDRADYRNFGFLDLKGKEIIPPIYSEASNFSEGVVWVKKMDKKLDSAEYQLLDRNGREILKGSYTSTEEFISGISKVAKDDKYGGIDKSGKIIIPFIYNQLENLGNNLLHAKLDGNYFFLTSTGVNLRLSKNYSFNTSFIAGLAEVSLEKKIGFLNTNGVEIIPAKYDMVWSRYAFRKEGFIGVELNGKKGFVDIYGNEYFDF